MDLSLTTDFESALLNWDVDEVNNAPTPCHNENNLNNDDVKHKNMISSSALAAVTTTSTSHDAATSLPSLPKQQEILQQLNYQQLYQQPQLQQQQPHNFIHSQLGRPGTILGGSKRTAQTVGLGPSGTTANNAFILDGNPISQSPYYHAILPSSEVTTTSNNAAPNLYQHHANSTTHQNNTNLLLNGFVTALDNKSRIPTLQQSNYQVTQQSNTSGSSSASSGGTVNGQTINTDKSSSPSIQVEQQQQLQQQQRTPQHLQVDGVTNPFWNLMDSSSNQSGTNVCTTNPTAPYMERIFPPNYFLPGTVSCDPSQAQPNSSNSSSTKASVINSIVRGETTTSFGEYGAVKSKIDNPRSTPSTSQSTILGVQTHQQHNQLNIGNTSVTPWGQRVPQHQTLPPRTMQISHRNPTNTTESILTQQTLAAQNARNSQISGTNTIVDAPMSCGTNNVLTYHQSMYHLNSSGYGSSQPIGSVTTTTNGVNDTATTPVGGEVDQQLQQVSPSAPFQYVTTNSKIDDNPSSSNGNNTDSGDTLTAQKRPPQDPDLRSKAKKKARKNSVSKTSKQGKGHSNASTAPPFYLFDAPCELRTNFIQAQQLNNITVVQDNNAYHYGMAVNGFHPQLNAQANPSIQPTTKISNGSGTSPTSPDHVVLLDGRHKNKIRQGNERNEREQQRAQKITELIDRLRMTMVNGGWKKNEMKSKYQTLSTCAAYVKYLIQETKKKEAAIEKARSNLAIRDLKFDEDKALQDSRSDPESVASSLTASSAFGINDGRKGQLCDERGEKDGSRTSIPSIRAVSSSSGGGSDNNNNSNGSSNNKNDDNCNNFPPGKQNENKHRVGEVGDNNQLGSVRSSRSVSDSSNRKDRKSRSDWQDISIHNRCSSMSEISDDAPSSKSGSGSDSGDGNTGSSSLTSSTTNGSNGSSNLTLSTKNQSHNRESGDISEASSVSSTAAVMSGSKDSINDKKIKHVGREKTSLEVDFELNYQEVFLASNIPQLIATPTGRIAICNDFFHRATGMSEQDVQRITIFSIVKADGLSTLFELVATSLRRSNKPSSTEECTTGTPSGPWSPSNNNSAYKTVTLPCIPFPKGLKCKSSKSDNERLCPLYMAVTFMSDDNPKNRCIHCILTEDGPGTGIGTITPRVLKKMFTGNGLGERQMQPIPIPMTKSSGEKKVILQMQPPPPISKTKSSDDKNVKHEVVDV